MALIQSATSTSKLIVDPTSQAARVTLYDASGNALPTLNVLLVAQAAASSIPTGVVSLGNNLGKTNVMRPGSLATTAITADQVVLTYTVTVGKTLYLHYLTFFARLTTMAATATNFGSISLESPAGTKLITDNLAGGAGASQYPVYMPAEPIPIAGGTVVRVVCTPAATTGITWTANFGGYEK